MRALTSSHRLRVAAFIAASVLILVAAIALRASTPLPFAPRVRVRWNATLDADQRAALERQFRLFMGESHDHTTWEYDLVDSSPALVAALVAHPDVADTHYLDRSTGRIAPDAPAGSIRLRGRPIAAFVHSIAFNLVLLFWTFSIIVSGVWLASGADPSE